MNDVKRFYSVLFISKEFEKRIARNKQKHKRDGSKMWWVEDVKTGGRKRDVIHESPCEIIVIL